MPRPPVEYRSGANDPKRTSAFELEEARNWETGHQLSWVEPFP